MRSCRARAWWEARRRRPGRSSACRARGRARGTARVATARAGALPRAPESTLPRDPGASTCSGSGRSHFHVLGAHVLRPAVPVVVRVVVLAGHEPAEQDGEVLEEPALPLVDPHGAGRVRRVHAADAVADPALVDGVLHFLGDVRDGEPASGAEVRFVLERLHGRVTILSAAHRLPPPKPTSTSRTPRSRTLGSPTASGP